MTSVSRKSKIPAEFLFQAALTLLLGFLYVFDLDHNHVTRFDFNRVSFFALYLLASIVISYWMLPRFLYRRKYVHFAVILVALICSVILLEELVLEQMFYPDTRAKGFPGVLFTLVEVMPVILILSGFKFVWDALQAQREVKNLKQAVLESELNLLRSQVSPHFLFNNLNNLYAHAVEQSPQTPKIILELSAMLRYMLYDCKEPFVEINKEREHLEAYIELHQLHVGDRGVVEVNFSALPDNVKIAPMILIVFVENAFKHSLSSMTKDIHISISMIYEAGELIFSCKNRFEQESNTDQIDKGIGLKNVTQRLKLIYPEHTLKIKDTPPSYEVELRLKPEE